MKHNLMPTLIAAGVLMLSGVAQAGDASSGEAAWTEEHTPADGTAARSCATCHGEDLTKSGQVVNTGKYIAPMAYSVNPRRLTDPGKVAKWFRRDCRWTLGRDCTATEKDDFFTYISGQ